VTWAYFYFMKDDPARVRETAQEHAQYWRQTGVSQRGGPFGDRSGGLIVFESPSENMAHATIADDPFQRAALLEQWWLKAWEADKQRP